MEQIADVALGQVFEVVLAAERKAADAVAGTEAASRPYTRRGPCSSRCC
jgi:hypothetical protein